MLIVIRSGVILTDRYKFRRSYLFLLVLTYFVQSIVSFHKNYKQILAILLGKYLKERRLKTDYLWDIVIIYLRIQFQHIWNNLSLVPKFQKKNYGKIKLETIDFVEFQN